MLVFEFRLFILRALLTCGICVTTCEADVPCACSINTEVAVYELDYDKSLVIGHILKHECKPQIHIHTSKIDSGWIAVIMDQKVGFVQNSPNVVEKSCMVAKNAYDGYLCPHTGQLMTNASQTGNCYEFVDILKEPRDLAETYCKLNQGHLLSVTSVNELEFVFSIAPKNASVSTQFWTGFSTIQSNSSWSDGSDTSFLMSMHRNLSNNITNPSICTVYEASGRDGVWTDSNCATPHGFICKYVHTNLTISSYDATKTPNSIQPSPASSCKQVFGNSQV
ncbi:macrophage mannose receptor 1-like [Dreissena polymorpha]|uniref:macrophage mannose receptor 1-like n=1 Tax=Dreissena polymorpha TaxID=45954 RepID=UPI00226504D4|nr:macrophage mannose receptor 1-like [Dreissena polymorpha]